MKNEELTDVTLLVLDGCNTLSFAAAVDPLRAANRQAGKPLYRWQFATPSTKRVSLSSGIALPENPVHVVARTDLLVIVASANAEAQTSPELAASLRRLARQHTRIAGIDGGPWAMARAGLLDGKRATIHWEDLDLFAQSYPQIDVVNARFQTAGPHLTCAGAAPAIEMMLHLIGEAQGAALADRVASALVFDPAPPRPQQRHRDARHNALTARAAAMMEAHLDAPLTVKSLAAALGVSARALQMQFRARLNTTPQAHARSLRLSEAERMIRDTQMPLQEVALATGFGGQATFARAFRKHFGCSATQKRLERPS